MDRLGLYLVPVLYGGDLQMGEGASGVDRLRLCHVPVLYGGGSQMGGEAKGEWIA